MSAARILHVEDDAFMREALAEGLALYGHSVHSVADHAGAFEALAERSFDLAIIDMLLPSGDGVSICTRVKQLDPAMGVLFLTARPETREKVRALEAGGDDYCVKPIDLDELEARIRVLLRTRALTRSLEEKTRKFRRIALVDALTSLPNRRAFDLALPRAWARAERSGRPVALLIGDVDRFKQWNDRHGHRAGDEVLRLVARAVAGGLRRGDEAFRIGGDELAVIAPDADVAGAWSLAERLAREVTLAPIEGVVGTSGETLSISIGHAIGPDGAIANPGALIEAADRALYAVKASRHGLATR